MAELRAIGRYQLLQVIGKGGMGVVYLARDPILQRFVALKVLAPHLAADETVVARFINEARIAASLQHPNIVTVYEAGQDGDLVFMAMEFVDGKDLATLLRQKGRLHPDEAIAILKAIASALDYAHQRGVIHRDVKPSNVLVSEDGIVKLMDFGIARVIGGERHTKTGVLVGTPEYMAPELWEGKEADKRADLYALGVMAYEMLTGEVPFTGETPITVGYKHVHGEVPRSGLGEAVDEVLKVAMAKERERRFQSGMALVTALEGALTGKAVALTPPEVSVGVQSPAEVVREAQRATSAPSVGMGAEKKPIAKQETNPFVVLIVAIFAYIAFALIVALVMALIGWLLHEKPWKARSREPVIEVPLSQATVTIPRNVPQTVQPPSSLTVTLVRTLTGHILGVNSVSFSPDGQFLALGSSDDTVKIWRVSDGKEVRTLTGHTNLVRSVAFSHDGQFLASGSDDNTVKIWRVSLPGSVSQRPREKPSLPIRALKVWVEGEKCEFCGEKHGKVFALLSDGTVKMLTDFGTGPKVFEGGYKVGWVDYATDPEQGVCRLGSAYLYDVREGKVVDEWVSLSEPPNWASELLESNP